MKKPWQIKIKRGWKLKILIGIFILGAVLLFLHIKTPIMSTFDFMDWATSQPSIVYTILFWLVISLLVIGFLTYDPQLKYQMKARRLL